MICISWVTMSAKSDAQHQRGDDADEDDLLALLGGKARGQRADDDRIVAGQHQVDHQHLEEGREGRRLGDVREILDDRGPDVGRPAEASRRRCGAAAASNSIIRVIDRSSIARSP